MPTISHEFNAAKSVAFTGHRSAKMNDPIQGFDSIRRSLRSTLMALCEQGYDTFYSGMAEGFDLIAAEEVIALKRMFFDAKLIAVIPFTAQSRGMDAHTAQRYEDVLEASDNRIVLSDAYHAACFHKRNDFLVDSSSVLVCCYNGSSGGTQYTVRRAKKSGHKIINLDPDYIIEPQLSLDI